MIRRAAHAEVYDSSTGRRVHVYDSSGRPMSELGGNLTDDRVAAIREAGYHGPIKPSRHRWVDHILHGIICRDCGTYPHDDPAREPCTPRDLWYLRPIPTCRDNQPVEVYRVEQYGDATTNYATVRVIDDGLITLGQARRVVADALGVTRIARRLWHPDERAGAEGYHEHPRSHPKAEGCGGYLIVPYIKTARHAPPRPDRPADPDGHPHGAAGPVGRPGVAGAPAQDEPLENRW